VRLCACRAEWYPGPFRYLEVFTNSKNAMANDTSYWTKSVATHAATMLPKGFAIPVRLHLRDIFISEVEPMEQLLKT
jgi:hypothetical protein